MIKSSYKKFLLCKMTENLEQLIENEHREFENKLKKLKNFYRIHNKILSGLFKFYSSFAFPKNRKIEGAENIPEKGPVFVAANHLHQLDPFIIGFYVHRRRFNYVANGKFFEKDFYKHLGFGSMSGIASKVISNFLTDCGTYPVYPKNPEKNRKFFDYTYWLAEKGEVGLWFVTGRIVDNIDFIDGKPGLVHTILSSAYRSKIPIVPASIIYEPRENIPNISPIPSFYRVTEFQVRFGEPFYITKYFDDYNKADYDGKSEIAKNVMKNDIVKKIYELNPAIQEFRKNI